MKTELDQQLQTEDALSNVQAAQPLQLVDSQLTSTLPPFYQDESAWDAARPKDLVTPPTPKEINKQMWVGSFMTALIVGLTTKDAGAALTGGLLGAIAIHDYGHALRKRGEHVPDMAKKGYSAQAILAYYEDGNQEILNQERDDMLSERRFKEQTRTSDRNFIEGQRRFDENSDYRDESLRSREYNQAANRSQREQIHGETMSFRRESLDARNRMALAQRNPVMFDPSAPNARQQAQKAMMKATDGQRKAAAFANRIYRGLDVVESLQGQIDPGRVGEITKAIGTGSIASMGLDASEQRYVNALSDVIAAIVRKDSGAAVTENEWEIARAQYMPLYGDEAEVIQQKFEFMRGRGADSEAEAGGILEPMAYLGGQDVSKLSGSSRQQQAQEMPATDKAGNPNMSYKQQLMETYGELK
ncbi:hypothetical protein [Buttiauxella sp. A111]|uniref:hypothetical protein n=1 Tax=Buttiauxella sp. A111 TaxID=2563088 RepID=UPI0010EDE6C7|nr:hypothetical protein [Buttiauxella sp. A111]GDX06345.1 hypothetical protein BSPA111_25540 [Buttiauxella sp. A111]